MLAKAVLAKADPSRRAYLIFLNGNLGSGKTTFMQELAKLLEVRGRVVSPTFVFVHEHRIPPTQKSPFKTLVHVDAYRIESKRDVSAIGLRQYAKDPDNLMVVEWGDRIAKFLPRPNLTIEFRHQTPATRAVKLTAHSHEKRKERKK